MADDRNRATKTTISGNTVRATARSATQAQQQPAQRSGPDPLVELARLIGQNEGAAVASAYDTTRAAVRRRDPESSAPTAPREAASRMTAPRAPAAPRAAESRVSAPREPVAPRAEPRMGTQRVADPRVSAPREPAAPRAEPRMGTQRVADPRVSSPREPVAPRAEPRMSAPREAAARAAEPPSPVAPRVDPRIAAPRVADPRAGAPRLTGSGAVETPPAAPPSLGRPSARGAERERYSDQHYDGYADPAAADPAAVQGRRSEPQVWRDTDLSDPYLTETGWRLPPRRGPAAPVSGVERPRTPHPTAAETLPLAEAKRLANAAQALAPAAMPTAAPRSKISPASLDDLRQTYERYSPAADEPYEAGDYYDDRETSAPEQGEYSGPYDNEGEYDSDEVPYEDQSQAGGRRKVWLALALVALAVIGTGGAYAVRTQFAASSQSAPPPIIRADTAPKKIAAAHPGDKQIQDRLGDRSETERVVPREEQPMTIKDPGASGLVSGVPSSAEPPVVGAPATTAATNSPFGTPESSEPRRIKTVTIRPEGEPAPAAAAASVPAAIPAQAVPAAAAPSIPLPQAAPPEREYMPHWLSRRSRVSSRATIWCSSRHRNLRRTPSPPSAFCSPNIPRCLVARSSISNAKTSVAEVFTTVLRSVRSRRGLPQCSFVRASKPLVAAVSFSATRTPLRRKML